MSEMAHAAEKPDELSPKKAIEVHNQTLDNYLRDIDFESMSPEDILAEPVRDGRE